MNHDEYNELKAMIDEIHGGDVRLGRVLHLMLTHLAGKAAAPVLEESPALVEEEAAAPSPIPRRASRQP